MAEYRPYRVINASAQTRLTQMKLVAVSGFMLMALLINWRVTQLVAGRFGYARPLGPAWFGFYAPWEWMVWWSRWHWVDRFQPIWEFSIREAAYPLLVVSAATAGVIVIARYFLKCKRFRSAWFRALGNERATCDRPGLIAPPAYLPRWLRRLLYSLGLLKALARRTGIYLGLWHGSYLRDCGPGHVLVMAPTRSGKGVGRGGSDLAHLAAFDSGARSKG